MVVIIDHDQVTKLQVASSAGCLAGNTLHGASITKKAVGVVVDKLIARLVKDASSVLLGNGQTHGIGETLTKRTSGDLDTRCVVSFWVTRGDAVYSLEDYQLPSNEPTFCRRTRKDFKSSIESL